MGEAERLGEEVRGEVRDAKRLADQRRLADLDAIAAREADRAREEGRREGLEAAHTAEQDRHLDAINGSIDEFRTELKLVKAEVSKLSNAFGEFVAVAKAMEAKGVTTRTFVLGVLAVIVPIIILFLAGSHA